MTVNSNNIKAAFVWLRANEEKELVDRFLYDVKILIQDAMDQNYHPTEKAWNTRLRYACEKIILLNTIYKEANGEPLLVSLKHQTDRQCLI